MLKKRLLAWGIWLVLWTMGVTPVYAQSSTSSGAAPIPTWGGSSSVKTDLLKAPTASLRTPTTHLSAAVFGGASVYNQANDPSINLNPYNAGIGDFQFRNQSKLREVVGARVGYSWDSLDMGEPRVIVPRLEFELMYSPYETSGTLEDRGVLTNLNGKVQIDSIVASMVGSVHFRVNPWFHPYVGAGVGGAYMHVSSEHLRLNNAGAADELRGEASDLVFVPQGLAGLEFDLAQGWSIFGEYKYLYYLDPRFDLDRHTLKLGDLGQHIIVGGLRYSF